MTINWDLHPLGKVSDGEIARKLGVTPSSVQKARQRRGIAANPNLERYDWAEQPLGKITDSELARRLGIVRSTVQRAREKRGIPPLVPRPEGPSSSYDIDWDKITTLGNHPDAVIARRLGVSKAAVGRARRARGIEFSSVAIDMAIDARTSGRRKKREKPLNSLSGFEDECVCCPCCYEVPCLGASGCGLEEDPVCEEKQCRKVEK